MVLDFFVEKRTHIHTDNQILRGVELYAGAEQLANGKGCRMVACSFCSKLKEQLHRMRKQSP